MFRIGKCTETENRLVVAGGWREWGMGSDCGVSFWGDENILKLIVEMDAQCCECNKSY